jgi:hypothetical protein
MSALRSASLADGALVGIGTLADGSADYPQSVLRPDYVGYGEASSRPWSSA